MVYEYGYEHGYEKRKDQRTELQAEGKLQSLLLLVLVAWNTLDTRGSTTSRRHIEILKSRNSYHSTLFVVTTWHTFIFHTGKASIICIV